VAAGKKSCFERYHDRKWHQNSNAEILNLKDPFTPYVERNVKKNVKILNNGSCIGFFQSHPSHANYLKHPAHTPQIMENSLFITKKVALYNK
jgi:hypothetical protein